MKAKLTLTLDEGVLDRARKYSRNRNISLSQLVDGFLRSLDHESCLDNGETTPLVEELTGVVKLPPGYNPHRVKVGRLHRKYK